MTLYTANQIFDAVSRVLESHEHEQQTAGGGKPASRPGSGSPWRVEPVCEIAGRLDHLAQELEALFGTVPACAVPVDASDDQTTKTSSGSEGKSTLDNAGHADIRGHQTMHNSSGSNPTTHTWAFQRHFEDRALGTCSELATLRIQEAVAEIIDRAEDDKNAAAAGAVILLELLSSGVKDVKEHKWRVHAAIHSAVCALTNIISDAPADHSVKKQWMDRLLKASPPQIQRKAA